MQIKNIDIRNFRVFDHLKVDDFGQINIILGKNNSGKTTLMEAILLAVSSTYPTTLFNLNQIREIRERSLSSLQGFFHKLDFKNSPLIEASFVHNKRGDIGETHGRRIEITASSGNLSTAANNKGDEKIESLIRFAPDTLINQINVTTTFLINQKRIENSIFFDLDNRISLTNSDNYVDQSSSAIFLASNATEEPALQRIGYLKKIKHDQELIETLKNIDPRIIDVQVIGDKLYFDIEGINELLPFSLMGDGIKKIISILASTIDTTASTLVLVDEIENGLHYSSHLKLWDSLLSIANNWGTQLFISTHNRETLHYLNAALLQHTSMQSRVRCFDIVKTSKAGYKAYKYTYDGFSKALSDETEIRL